jgi:hypothetical protein
MMLRCSILINVPALSGVILSDALHNQLGILFIIVVLRHSELL